MAVPRAPSGWRRRAHAPRNGTRNDPRTPPSPAPESSRAPCRATPPRACYRSSRARPRRPYAAALMRHETEPETIRERLHLRHRNHLAPRAAQHHHVRVIDHHALDHAARMPQRVGEKYLAVESVKCRMDLEKQHPRVEQDTGGGLRLVLPAAHLDGVRRRIMQHLHAWLEVILARRFDRRLPDALPPAEARQRLIR